MDTKIKKILDSNKVKFKTIGHRKVYTAFNEAETQHIDPRTVVKTVLVKTDKNLMPDGLGTVNPKLKILNLALVSVPAGKRVDLKKIAKTINDYQAKIYKAAQKANPKTKPPLKITAKLGSEKDITKSLKTKVGLLHPFGGLFGLPVLMDKKLAKNKKLVISAGSYTESVELSVKDYLKVACPIVGKFTE